MGIEDRNLQLQLLIFRACDKSDNQKQLEVKVHWMSQTYQTARNFPLVEANSLSTGSF